MKRTTFLIAFIFLFTLTAFSQSIGIYKAPPDAQLNGTSGNRGPNGTTNHTTMRAQYFVPASELSGIANGTNLSKFGFKYVNGATGGNPASGQLTVYFMNTMNTSYSLGTVWNAANMTKVYDSTFNIPSIATSTTADVSLSTAFAYTGGGLYVAYEYKGATFAASPAIYNCIAPASPNQGATGASNTTTAPNISTTLFRPQFRFGIPCTPSTYTLKDTTCDSYALNGKTYTSSGIYTQTLTNAAGCDSILTLDLTIKYSTKSTVADTVCDSLTLNGKTYIISGKYTQTLKNAVGCDSTLTLDLVVNHSTKNVVADTACDSYTLNAKTYTISGKYTQTLINAMGCDSILTLNLVINHSTKSTVADTACDSYTLNGKTYTTSGKYIQTLTNAVGCDSLLTLNLIIHHADTAVSLSGNILTSQATSSTYQWIDCSNGNKPILNATAQTYTVSTNGSYAVIVTQGSCVDTSVCYKVIATGILKNNYNEKLQIFPNPASDKIQILSSDNFGNAHLEIYNSAGQRIADYMNVNGKSFSLDISGYAKGLYYVRLINNEVSTYQKWIKD